MDAVVLAWYGWLSGLTQGVVFGLQDWANRLQIPVLTALLFGLIGAASPCQLSTNLGALAYAAARPGGGGAFRHAVAYVGGKVMVYSLVGAAAIVAGQQLQVASIPVVVAVRKALGPLMIVVALGLLGVVRLRAGFGQGLAERLRARFAGRGAAGAFLLGVAFSFAFCPTLFWLFFGLTVPLALQSGGGWAFPGLFAVGASLPLLVVAATVGAGVGAAEAVAGGVRRLDRPLRAAAAVVLVAAGLHDTVMYWLL